MTLNEYNLQKIYENLTLEGGGGQACFGCNEVRSELIRFN